MSSKYYLSSFHRHLAQTVFFFFSAISFHSSSPLFFPSTSIHPWCPPTSISILLIYHERNKKIKSILRLLQSDIRIVLKLSLSKSLTHTYSVMLTKIRFVFYLMRTDHDSGPAADTKAALKKSYELKRMLTRQISVLLEEGMFFLINPSKASVAIITYLFCSTFTLMEICS